MENLVRAICRKEGLSAGSIQVLSGGQVNQVYLVDNAFIVRVGARHDAYQRLKHETELIQNLAGQIPVPKIYAFGQLDDFHYQVQQYIPGKKLYAIWKDLLPAEQESIVEQLAEALKNIHARTFPDFGYGRQDSLRFTSWSDFLLNKFQETQQEFRELKIQLAPGFLDMAVDFFDEHKHVLQEGVPSLLHGDLTLVNLLADNGKLSAILDFEYSIQAPPDYELWTLEAFCLYPNDWAEEDNEIFCTADYANIIPLLRKYYPTLFEIPNLRQRMNLYHIDAALGSHLAWRKDNLTTIPPEKLAAKEFYMARITNFIFDHGARMFFA
jgi:aminoglycoside phosphotransferase (APT) family kinase protein